MPCRAEAHSNRLDSELTVARLELDVAGARQDPARATVACDRTPGNVPEAAQATATADAPKRRRIHHATPLAF